MRYFSRLRRSIGVTFIFHTTSLRENASSHAHGRDAADGKSPVLLAARLSALRFRRALFRKQMPRDGHGDFQMLEAAYLQKRRLLHSIEITSPIGFIYLSFRSA